EPVKRRVELAGVGPARARERIDVGAMMAVEPVGFDQEVDLGLQRDLFCVASEGRRPGGEPLGASASRRGGGRAVEQDRQPLRIDGAGITLVGFVERLEEWQVVYAERVLVHACAGVYKVDSGLA